MEQGLAPGASLDLVVNSRSTQSGTLFLLKRKACLVKLVSSMRIRPLPSTRVWTIGVSLRREGGLP